MSNNNEKMREAFEGFIAKETDLKFVSVAYGTPYQNLTIEYMWQAYQAAYTTALADEQAIRADERAKVVELERIITKQDELIEKQDARISELIESIEVTAKKVGQDARKRGFIRRALAVREGV